jgi:hypothetical protein
MTSREFRREFRQLLRENITDDDRKFFRTAPGKSMSKEVRLFYGLIAHGLPGMIRYHAYYASRKIWREIKRPFKRAKECRRRLATLEAKINAISRNVDFANHHILVSADSQHMALAVAKQHEKVFPQFKNKHKGEDFVIMGTGPTLNEYKPIENTITMGINFAHNNHQGIKLDYWVSVDILNNVQYLDYLKTAPFVKFFGQYAGLLLPNLGLRDTHGNSRVYPDRYIDEVENGYKYYVKTEKQEFTRNIETDAIQNFCSSVFSALTIALYMGADRIYLVGCDCTASGYFDPNHFQPDVLPENLINAFKLFKEHIQLFYPDVEIVSINPVGLKGMFRDIYTNKEAEQ